MRFLLASPPKVFFLHNDWGQTKCAALKWLPFMPSWVIDYTSSTQWWWLWFHRSLGYQAHVRVCKSVCHSPPPSPSLLSGWAWWSPSAFDARADTEMTWVMLLLHIPCRFRTGSLLFAPRVWHAPLWEPRSPRVRCTADNTYISIYPLLITQALSNLGR